MTMYKYKNILLTQSVPDLLCRGNDLREYVSDGRGLTSRGGTKPDCKKTLHCKILYHARKWFLNYSIL